MATPIRSTAQELSRVPDNQLACRAAGHEWPKLRAGKKLSKYIKLEPNPIERVCCVYEICANCGKQRWFMTLPEGIYPDTIRREYINPNDWVRIPRTVSRAEIKEENYRRALEPIIKRLFEANIAMRY